MFLGRPQSPATLLWRSQDHPAAWAEARNVVWAGRRPTTRDVHRWPNCRQWSIIAQVAVDLRPRLQPHAGMPASRAV